MDVMLIICIKIWCLEKKNPSYFSIFRSLQGQVHSIALKGVDDAYAKHTDKAEAKGIKAHFRMDESGVLSLETVSFSSIGKYNIKYTSTSL